MLVSISQSTRDFAEHAGRTEPTFGDVILALASSGIDFDDLKVNILKNPNSLITFINF